MELDPLHSTPPAKVFELAAGYGAVSGQKVDDMVRQQEQLSSGLRVNRASDDPIAAAQAERAMVRLERIKTDQRALETQRSALADVLGQLGTRASDTEASFRNGQITFNFQQDGDQPREVVKFNAALSHFENVYDTLFSSNPTLGLASLYTTNSNQQTTAISLKLDVEQPLEPPGILAPGPGHQQGEEQDPGTHRAMVGGGRPRGQLP